MDVAEIRLRNLIDLQGKMTRRELCERIGIDYATVGFWFMDSTKEGHRNISATSARKIEAAFQKPHGWLDQINHEVREPGALVSNVSDVPIVGFAIATPERDGYFTDGEYPVGHGEGFIPWPTRDPNAYALRVKGDSMQPRIRPGELIVIEPNVKAELMDDVLVRTRDGRRMVKQLLNRRAGEITLGSINQAHQQQTISVEEIESIHFVTAIVPRGANIKETRDPLEGTW